MALLNDPFVTLSEYEGKRFYATGEIYTRGGDVSVPGVYTSEGSFWRPMALTPDNDGYLTVKLGGKTKTVHTIICRAFHGPKPAPNYQACHNDGVKINCRADNLRWGTPVENRADQELHGTGVRGERHHKAKVSDADLAQVFQWNAEGKTQTEIASRLNVSQAWVSRILNGKRRS